MPPKTAPKPDAPAEFPIPIMDADRANLWSKIAWVQHHVTHVEKTGNVSFGNTKFKHMQEHGLIEVLRPLCRAIGLSYTFGMVPGGWKSEGNSYYVECKLTVTDTATGQQTEAHFVNVGVDNADKGFNKAYTGAMKYGLQKFFAVPTEGIDDNETVDIKKEVAAGAPAASGRDLIDAQTADALRKTLIEANVDPSVVTNHLTAMYGVSSISAVPGSKAAEFGQWVTKVIKGG